MIAYSNTIEESLQECVMSCGEESTDVVEKIGKSQIMSILEAHERNWDIMLKFVEKQCKSFFHLFP